jgi:hypothetical protein
VSVAELDEADDVDDADDADDADDESDEEVVAGADEDVVVGADEDVVAGSDEEVVGVVGAAEVAAVEPVLGTEELCAASSTSDPRAVCTRCTVLLWPVVWSLPAA